MILKYFLGSENIEPVISLTVRAYDLGIPSLDSEVLVHIFTEVDYYFEIFCIYF